MLHLPQLWSPKRGESRVLGVVAPPLSRHVPLMLCCGDCAVLARRLRLSTSVRPLLLQSKHRWPFGKRCLPPLPLVVALLRCGGRWIDKDAPVALGRAFRIQPLAPRAGRGLHRLHPFAPFPALVSFPTSLSFHASLTHKHTHTHTRARTHTCSLSSSSPTTNQRTHLTRPPNSTPCLKNPNLRTP